MDALRQIPDRTAFLVSEVPGLFSLQKWREIARRGGFDLHEITLMPEVSSSTRSLERLFRRNFGATPSNLLIQWRAEEARDYIVATGASNKQAAAQFGFFDEAHLCHTFMRVFNRTPHSFSPRPQEGGQEPAIRLSIKYKKKSDFYNNADLDEGEDLLKRNSRKHKPTQPHMDRIGK